MISKTVLFWCATGSFVAHAALFSSGDDFGQIFQHFSKPGPVSYTFEGGKASVGSGSTPEVEMLETSPFSLIVVSDTKKEIRDTIAIAERTGKNSLRPVSTKSVPFAKLNLNDHQKRRLFMNYYQMLCLKIKDKAQYPQEAREKRLEGISYLTFSLKPDGTVDSISVEKTSGLALLDYSARLAVKEAAPFPSFPKLVSEVPLQIHVPIAFEFPKDKNQTPA